MGPVFRRGWLALLLRYFFRFCENVAQWFLSVVLFLPFLFFFFFVFCNGRQKGRRSVSHEPFKVHEKVRTFKVYVKLAGVNSMIGVVTLRSNMIYKYQLVM
jgi:hypothetical protein